MDLTKKLAILLMVVPLYVQATPEFVGIQGRAQGHSLTGSSQLNDSLYSNPAASTFTQVYALEGIFEMPKSFAVSILDTKTSDMGGGLGYFRRNNVDPNIKPFHGGKVSLAGRVAEQIGFGVGGKMLWGPNSEGVDSKLTDIDVGLLSQFGIFQAGIVLRNALGGDETLGQPREWSAGGRVGWQDTLFFNVATASKFETAAPYQYSAGAEYISPYYFAIKGGYRIQPQNNLTFWSGGLSFISPRLSLHYAVEFPQENGKAAEHAIATTLLF